LGNQAGRSEKGDDDEAAMPDIQCSETEEAHASNLNPQTTLG
jgi:hypothetical protein